MLQRPASRTTWRNAHVAMVFAAVHPAAVSGTDEQISKPNLGNRWRC